MKILNRVLVIRDAIEKRIVPVRRRPHKRIAQLPAHRHHQILWQGRLEHLIFKLDVPAFPVQPVFPTPYHSVFQMQTEFA